MNGGMKNSKKRIENLAFFLIILIVTLIVINTIVNVDKNNKNENKESLYKELAVNNKSSAQNTDDLEEKIEHILGTMSGIRQSKCFNYIFTIFRGNCYV